MEQQKKQKQKKKAGQNGGNTVSVHRKGPTDIQIRGNGKYSIKDIIHATLSGIPKGTFSSVGSALGTAVGGPGGGMIGGAMGKGLSMMSGYGEYILNDIVHRQGAPAMADPNTARRIVHSEFITDILSTGATFKVGTVLTVNPGDDVCFPWLSAIARRFTKYRFQQLIFEFRSTTSDYSTNSAMGSVIIGPNYNPVASAPPTKPAMESMTGMISSKPSNSLLAGVECAVRNGGNPERWVRNPDVNVQTQLTDLCDFYVATSGLAATSGTALGELWVHYTVDLFEPYYAPSSVGGIEGGLVNIVTTGQNIGKGFGNIGPTGNTFTALFGTVGLTPLCVNSYAGQPPSSASYVLSIDTGTDGRLWFGRAGKYVLRTKLLAASAFTSQTGACWTYALSDAAATLTKPAGASESGSTSQAICEHFVTILSPGTSLTYTYNTIGWGTAPNVSNAYTTFEAVG